jgi:hypothetical protein
VTQLVPSLIIGALVVLALVGMVLSWRARQRRQAALDVARAVPDALSPSIASADLLYVATTAAETPLERIAVAGLGARGKARIDVHPEGVVLDIRGSEPVYIPAEHLVTAGFGTFTIDRVVERDGMAVITWLLAGTAVDSYLRPSSTQHKRAIVDAVSAIARGSIASISGTTERNPQ